MTDERPTVGRSGTRIGDSAQPAFDPGAGTYLLFTRHPWMSLPPRSRPLHATELGGHPTWDASAGAANRRGRRRIYLSESRDYLHWSQPRLILAPDPVLDNIDDSFYSMSAMWLGGQWIGFVQVFHMVENTLDVQLVHSRDGRNWQRLFPGQAWLPLGPPGSWNQFYSSLPRFPDVEGPEWLVFHGGSKSHHDWWFHGQQEGLDAPEAWDMSLVGFGLGLAKLRKFGFVSLDADRMREGMILTQPWVAPGDRLVINAACGPEGYVKVEALDLHDRVLAGCSRDNCDVFTGDAIEHTVTWGGDPHLPSTSPQPAARSIPTACRTAGCASSCATRSCIHSASRRPKARTRRGASAEDQPALSDRAAPANGRRGTHFRVTPSATRRRFRRRQGPPEWLPGRRRSPTRPKRWHCS